MMVAMKTSLHLLLLLLSIPLMTANGQCENGDIRITHENETDLEMSTGYLEMCNDTVWLALRGTEDGWSPNVAAVACRQLGYSAMGAQGYLINGDVESDGLVPMCLGNETRIEECPLTVGSGGKVNVLCQPLDLEVLNLTLCFFLNDTNTHTEGYTIIAAYLASLVQDNCSCAYSPEYVTVSPVHCNQNTTVRVTLIYSSFLNETIESLQNSIQSEPLQGICDDEVVLTITEECPVECFNYDLSHTSMETSVVVTYTQVDRDLSTVVMYTETSSISSTKEYEILPSSVSNEITPTPTHRPKSNNVKVILTAGIIGGSIALIVIALVVTGIIITIAKLKHNCIIGKLEKMKSSGTSSHQKKPVHYYDEVEEIDTVHTSMSSLFHSGISGSMFSIVRDKRSPSPTHRYDSVTPTDNLPKKTTVHIYDSVNDPPNDQTLTAPENRNGAKARVNPYRVSTIIKEPLLIDQNHSHSEGYSSLDNTNIPYATLEPFVHSHPEDLARDNGYSHLVH